jgi:hypothetical protein
MPKLISIKSINLSKTIQSFYSYLILTNKFNSFMSSIVVFSKTYMHANLRKFWHKLNYGSFSPSYQPHTIFIACNLWYWEPFQNSYQLILPIYVFFTYILSIINASCYFGRWNKKSRYKLDWMNDFHNYVNRNFTVNID